MMRRKQILTLAMASLTAASLSACTEEPTSADIEQAVREVAGRLPVFLTADAKPGEGMRPLVLSAKKIGCTAAKSAPGWNCDYELRVRQMGHEETVIKIMRFFRTDKGFAVAGIA